jgi:hypothetical protein
MEPPLRPHTPHATLRRGRESDRTAATAPLSGNRSRNYARRSCASDRRPLATRTKPTHRRRPEHAESCGYRRPKQLRPVGRCRIRSMAQFRRHGGSYARRFSFVHRELPPTYICGKSSHRIRAVRLRARREEGVHRGFPLLRRTGSWSELARSGAFDPVPRCRRCCPDPWRDHRSGARILAILLRTITRRLDRML